MITDNYGASVLQDKRLIQMENVSGGTLTTGTVVVYNSSAAGDEITTTTTAGDGKVIGVVQASINNAQYGKVCTLGKITDLKADGTTDIAIGDFLSTHTVAGVAKKATVGETAFAIALEAYTVDDSNGVIDALLISPRII
jgi:hypothetical protein